MIFFWKFRHYFFFISHNSEKKLRFGLIEFNPFIFSSSEAKKDVDFFSISFISLTCSNIAISFKNNSVIILLYFFGIFFNKLSLSFFNSSKDFFLFIKFSNSFFVKTTQYYFI